MGAKTMLAKYLQRLLQLSLLILLLNSHRGSCYQYKVGDLNAWGPPPPSNSQLYSFWSLHHNFSIGDSIMFLYPPSQDSVIQVTEQAFNSCSLSDPILKMNDGNSVFNITVPGYFYFTSDVPGHCSKYQKLVVAVPSANGSFFPPPTPADGPAVLPADSTSYPVVFGPSAAQGSGGQGSGSARRSATWVGVKAAVGAAIYGALLCIL